MSGRREFLRRSAVGAGVLALGASLGYGSGYAHATGLSGNTRTVITDSEVAARVIGGVRIATEFIPDPVPAGTDADPYPGSAIQAALNDGLHVYVPAGTWLLTATLSRAVDGATIIGAGKSTKLVFNGSSACISAGNRNGWLISNLAVDAGGVDVASASQSRFSEVWINGTLSDNRPIGSGGGGGAGYYGIRAADFITAGSGTDTNPWNASAIEAAINALPPSGGVVFVKSGVWSGSRIFLGGVGQAGRNKAVFLVGEGTSMTYHALGPDPNNSARRGTHIQCGFEVISNGCDLNVYHITLSPARNELNLAPAIKYIMDGGQGQQHYQLGGVEICDVLFVRGQPALQWTGRNVSSFPDSVTQHWNVKLDRVSFVLGGTAIQIDNGDAPLDNGIWRGSMRNLAFRSRNGNPRTVNIDIANLKLVMEHAIFEDCGTTATDYVMVVDCINAEGGVIIEDIDFGDGSNAVKDAYLACNNGGITVRAFRHKKNVDIFGVGDFELGTRPTETGNIAVSNGGALDFVVIRKYKDLRLGAVTASVPSRVGIDRFPESRGYIGGTLAGASPYIYTNNDMCAEYAYLVGGTIIDVSRNSQSVGPNRHHLLGPGDSITITHSAAPTVKRFGVPG